MDVGGKLLASLVEAGDIVLYRKLGLNEKLFYGDEASLFKFINNHVGKYHVLPKSKTVAAQFSDLPEATEPTKFYADQVEQRFIHKHFNKALTECSQLMKDQDTFTAMNTITEALVQIRATQARSSVAEFTADAHDLYMANYLKNQTSNLHEVLFGWRSLDRFGGARPGDVVSFVGRPAMGKTYSLLNIAMHGMTVQKTRNLFVSMEMPLIEIVERQVAMYAKYPMDHIQNYELTTKQQKHLPGVLMQAKKEEGKCWVLDGNFASTPEDIFSLVYQFDPHALFIDGAYLMQNQDRRLDKYKRVGVNIELIKRFAAQFGIPVFLSYQFNREASKKQKKSQGKEKGDLSDIAFADEVGQASSIVCGMFEKESVETLVAREIQVLKGRKGQVGSFKVNWDFLNMDFSEITDDKDLKEGKLKFV